MLEDLTPLDIEAIEEYIQLCTKILNDVLSVEDLIDGSEQSEQKPEAPAGKQDFEQQYTEQKLYLAEQKLYIAHRRRCMTEQKHRLARQLTKAEAFFTNNQAQISRSQGKLPSCHHKRVK